MQGSDKKKKKNWCPRAWPYEYGRLSKMATSPAGLDASRIHVVRRIVESSRVGGGFTAAQSTGVCYPLAPWRSNSRLEHLVITDSSFLLAPSLNFNPANFLTIFKPFVLYNYYYYLLSLFLSFSFSLSRARASQLSIIIPIQD